MKKTVYKYPLEIEDEQVVFLPTGARILTVQQQNNNIFLWALVNPTSSNTQAFTISMYGTGHPIDNSEKMEYINTVQLYSGELVFHVFVKRENLFMKLVRTHFTYFGVRYPERRYYCDNRKYIIIISKLDDKYLLEVRDVESNQTYDTIANKELFDNYNYFNNWREAKKMGKKVLEKIKQSKL